MTSGPIITLASAPGKVLVAGGYLVLDRAHSGLVVGTDACLYTAVQTQQQLGSSAAGAAAGVPVHVTSPQFESAWWTYSFDAATNALTQLASADQGRNGFVQVALQTALALANSRAPGAIQALLAAPGAGLKIVLGADNDFYSQREALARLGLPPTSAALGRIPARAETGKTLATVHKTGLGSSAAMVTSLVAAVLAHLGAADRAALSPGGGRPAAADADCVRLIHNAAQYAHCVAQGKIGSGFDVSAAVYGSHVYRRFSPAVLEAAMAADATAAALVEATSPQNPAWDGEVAPVAIPPRLALRLADVDAGSNTPSMVRKVLEWQRSSPEAAAELWASLDAANNRIQELWRDLARAHQSDRADYDRAIDWCSRRPSAEWRDAAAGPARALLADLAAAALRVRQLQRRLGECAGVPIEPPEQTRLLDACMAVPGVCMAAVPGAGGYDAIFCVVLGQDASDAVERLWAGWSEMSVGPLLARQASGGVCLHDPDRFPDLVARLA